jgi:hypothetical protein
MSEELKPAIYKLKQLAEDNKELCEKLEVGSMRETLDIQHERLNHLIRTYRYWSQCCLMAAWLLEQEAQ